MSSDNRSIEKSRFKPRASSPRAYLGRRNDSSFVVYFFILSIFCGCANGRSLTSKYYLPEWENRFVYLPSPSETSGGQWAVKGGQAVAAGVEQTVRVPLALAGNAALNSYYIPTWPFRWILRGDKRLIVWHPIFQVGESAGSKFFSSEWNQDLV